MNNQHFIETLMDKIIAFSKSNGVDLSTDDVTDIAIFTLYSIVTSKSGIEADATKKVICEMIGNDSKVAEYLFTTLYVISPTNDKLLDKEIAEGVA